MARRHWRLVSMWEGDPVGVDQKRPLVGFVLVAALCAVLMFVSVGRGFGLSDFVRPGRPIAAPVERTPAEPPGSALKDVPAAIPAAIPAELSAQPLAAVVAASAAKTSTEGSGTSGAAGSGGSGSSAAAD